MNGRMRVLFLYLSMQVLLLVPGVQVHAGVVIWTGSSGSGLWSDSNNWDTAVAPAAGGHVVIDAADTTVDRPFTIGALTTSNLKGGASGYHLRQSGTGQLTMRAWTNTSGDYASGDPSTYVPIQIVGDFHFDPCALRDMRSTCYIISCTACFVSSALLSCP